MPHAVPGRLHRVRAGVILTLFAAAVAGAAAIGWQFARGSLLHQGPIVLIAVDGVPISRLATYGAERGSAPAIDDLARDSVVFERAYTHSLLMLPANVSILSGQLPIEHGVRDDAGFRLKPDMRTLAEQLRSRGFATGAAVSSFLLRRESGLSQGFSYFDSDRPEPGAGDGVVLDRPGSDTVQAAERWVSDRGGRRFFLFVQVGGEAADLAVGRLVQILKDRGDYERSTILLVGDRGDVGPGMALDEAALSVPLLVKQPGLVGAGRRVTSPVQHIDLTPTILDLVRAPLPRGLRGRSLRAVLDGRDDIVRPAQPIYSESLAARFRFGGRPVFALTETNQRYLRGVGEELVSVGLRSEETPVEAPEAAATGRLRTELERMVDPVDVPRPARIEPADQDRYALAGMLDSVSAVQEMLPPLTEVQQTALLAAHREAAALVGQKRYSDGIRALRTIARDYPMLAAVQHQLGVVLARTGRLDEAADALRTSIDLQPDSLESVQALADVLLRTGEVEAAWLQIEQLVALAEREEDSGMLAAAHELAARIALARKDAEAANTHAEAAEAAEPSLPVRAFIRGRLLFDAGLYAEAVIELQEAADRGDAGALPELHLTLGEALAKLERYEEAEIQYRDELAAFPRSLQAYVSLALLYRATSREADVEAVLNELVTATSTPEGYALAARAWTDLGDRARATALRADARARFRGDPSLALLGTDRR